MLPRIPTPGVPPIDPPRRETTVEVGSPGGRRRRVGIAEFGDPEGRLVIWLHGTPGGRRQITPSGRRAASDLGIRLVCMERPGTGWSTGHRYGAVADVAYDVAAVADELGSDRFAVVGLSGGGPYALACSAVLGPRVQAVGVLGGVCPVVGPDAVEGGVVNLSRRFNRLLQPMRGPLGLGIRNSLLPLIPAATLAYDGFTRVVPEGDADVLRDPEVKAMFLDDLVEAMRCGIGSVAHDVALFGADWGFRLADVQAPVRWWHGDADYIIPLAHAEASVPRLRDVELYVRPGESHLGGFAVSDEVLKVISLHLEAGAA